MNEQTRRQLARRAAPYGLPLGPAASHDAARDERQEQAVQQRWQRPCETRGAAVLGIRDVPTEPIVAQLEGVRWLLEPLGERERWIPAYIFNRLRDFEGASIPFDWWLWGEELRPHPNLQPLPDPPAQRRDPLLIGVIRTGPGRGLWILLARWDD